MQRNRLDDDSVACRLSAYILMFVMDRGPFLLYIYVYIKVNVSAARKAIGSGKLA